MPCTLRLLGKKGAKDWPKFNNIIFDTVHFSFNIFNSGKTQVIIKKRECFIKLIVGHQW